MQDVMLFRWRSIYFDEAYERGMKLQQIELAKLDVNSSQRLTTV